MMKKFFCVLFLSGFLFTASAIDYTKRKYVEVTCEVNDTVAFTSYVDSVKAMIQHERDSIERTINQLNQMRDGGKVKPQTEEEKEALRNVYRLNYQLIRNQKHGKGFGSKLMGGMLQTATGIDMSCVNFRSLNVQPIENDKKFLAISDGKVDKAIVDAIPMAILTYERAVDDLNRKEETLQSEINRFDSGQDKRFRKTINVKVENPVYGASVVEQTMQHLNSFLEEEWKWATEGYLNYVSKEYPEKVSYYVSDDHSEYTVYEDGLFDTKGKLIRALRYKNFTNSSDAITLPQAYMDDIKNDILVVDYKNNKYDIKKESAETQKYLRWSLKLEQRELNKKAVDNFSSAVANTVTNYARTPRQQKAANRKAANAFASLLFSSFEYDEKGVQYLKQLRADHNGDLYTIYSMERLDDLSFKILFLNGEGKSTYAAKLTYVQTKPYRYEVKASLIGPDNSVQTKILTMSEYEKELSDIGVKIVPGMSNDESVINENLGKFSQLDNDERKRIRVKTKVYDLVEQMPEFPGGTPALMQYLAKNIKYPTIAQENGTQGKVIVQFVVLEDGSIANVEVMRSVDPSLDQEAVRVVETCPKWIPGRQNGTPVAVKYSTPVVFRLQ